MTVLHSKLAAGADDDGAICDIGEEDRAVDWCEVDVAVGGVADEAGLLGDDEVGGVGFEIFSFVVCVGSSWSGCRRAC